MKRNMKRKGFTLVELLIVIVVIGILSAMMMLSSTEAVSSSKASNIVSNLRNLKTAALSLYVDKLDTWKSTTASDNSELTIGNIKQYLNEGSGSNFTGYGITLTPTTDKIAECSWYLSYHIGGGDSEVSSLSGENSRIADKLAGRAKSVGLLSAAADPTTSGTTTTGYYTSTGKTVYYKVR